VGGRIARNERLIEKDICPGIIARGKKKKKKVLEDADVYVDITAPEPASAVITKVPAMGVNMVIGTTGISDIVVQKMKDKISECGTSAVLSANYAIGVNVFWKMCESLAGALKGYDIEVIETHHNQKRDAPSGTALEAVKRMQKITGIDEVVCGREGIVGARKNEIGVHSIRCGDVVGDHMVMFAGSGEIIELRHRAGSREAFAKGFMESIRWIYKKKDGKVHEMSEVLGL
jgi:4-hydroxy-tetrahydrodipicolinate reductase